MTRGDRISTALTVTRYTPFKGQYGDKHIYAFVSDDGTRLVWFGTTPLHVRVSRDETHDIFTGTWPVRFTVQDVKDDGEAVITRAEIALDRPEPAGEAEQALKKAEWFLNEMCAQAAALSKALYALSFEKYDPRLILLAARGHARSARRLGRLKRCQDELSRIEGERVFGPGRALLEERGLLSK